MQIFFLDKNPEVAAKYLCDKHIVKMGIEATQILSSVLHLLNIEHDGYRLTHKNHPCVKWVCESSRNYRWVYRHAKAIFEEYTRRYGKIHKSSLTLDKLPVNVNYGIEKITKAPKCMDDEFKVGNLIDSYRNYYIKDKANFAKWKFTEIPHWFK